MGELNQIKWTKFTLVEALNQRIDRSELVGGYVFEQDITDAALEQFQVAWDTNEMRPVEREREIKKLYQAIIAGF